MNCRGAYKNDKCGVMSLSSTSIPAERGLRPRPAAEAECAPGAKLRPDRDPDPLGMASARPVPAARQRASGAAGARVAVPGPRRYLVPPRASVVAGKQPPARPPARPANPYEIRDAPGCRRSLDAWMD